MVYKALTQTVRKYYKTTTTTQSWSQPTISSDGTLGGDSFAVNASNDGSNHSAYKAFNSGLNGWRAYDSSANKYTFYNPTPIKVTGLSFSGAGAGPMGGYTKSYNLYASNNGANWTSLGSYNQNTDATTIVYNSISNNSYYKYYRIDSTSRNTRDAISSLVITATEQITTIIESTSSDYDFYKDVNTYQIVKETSGNTNVYKALRE